LKLPLHFRDDLLRRQVGISVAFNSVKHPLADCYVEIRRTSV
jgi:hypothetical protein